MLTKCYQMLTGYPFFNTCPFDSQIPLPSLLSTQHFSKMLG